MFFSIFTWHVIVQTIKQEVKHSHYNLSIKGEKYQLDLSKLLMSWSDCFLNQSKYFDQLSHRNKNKSKKRFVGLTEKYLKIEEYLNIYDGKLFERN